MLVFSILNGFESSFLSIVLTMFTYYLRCRCYLVLALYLNWYTVDCMIPSPSCLVEICILFISCSLSSSILLPVTLLTHQYNCLHDTDLLSLFGTWLANNFVLLWINNLSVKSLYSVWVTKRCHSFCSLTQSPHPTIHAFLLCVPSTIRTWSL